MIFTNKHVMHAFCENKVKFPDVKWKNIGGLGDTKCDLQEMVRSPIKHRSHFTKIGMSSSWGVLFCGLPGCSKKLIFNAIANMCSANFISAWESAHSLWRPSETRGLDSPP